MGSFRCGTLGSVVSSVPVGLKGTLSASIIADNFFDGINP